VPTLVPNLLFGLEGDDRESQSIRSVGGVVIAMEDPVYAGRLPGRRRRRRR
jgi:hypothetical protein